MGWLKMQALTFFSQSRLDFAQRRTGTDGQNKLHRVIVNDTGMLAHVEGSGIGVGFPAH
eukprot:CAMPEP_0181280282 /NCGR_PEP_ID=MMETSP1097-20121128/12849_1 /TAXON_ID=35684 /ORGANISM="Pseudopedinella elastica, Strain CCMP716" /LENGTH=58 /DNA_ID=CAMNT_0023382763 /DNA_START=48 /DNA_END=221 /DNA_ORIENTATION=-